MDHSKDASKVFDKLADLYQAKFMDVSRYSAELDSFVNSLSASTPSILEIACGPGNITKYLLGKNSKLNILGIDLAPKMIELARLNCPEATFQVLDCRQINSISKTFDGIVVGFCLPYLEKQEAENLLKDISDLLNPNGLLYISTIEGDYNNSGYRKGSTGDVVFMHYYTLKDIQNMLSETQLDVLSTRSLSNLENSNSDTDLIIVAVKRNGL